jgi:hypothetical protein
MGGTYRTRGRVEKFIKISVEKSEWKRKIRKIRHRWEGNIKTDRREIE